MNGDNPVMEDTRPGRGKLDTGQYARRSREGPCFVCALLGGHPDYRHHEVYQDEEKIAFLARYPTLRGYCLVAPKRHVESWIHEMDQAAFLRLQAVARNVARAIAATVPTERMYALSLGSQHGNAHLHWHLAPLPPGVAHEQEQFAALKLENGVLEADDSELADLARLIRSNLADE
jgi:diadenosine tetraphosphate (Ap4A) HIT family hydrolase